MTNQNENMNPYYRPDETVKQRLLQTKFLCEATHYEARTFWAKFAAKSPERDRQGISLDWHPISPGFQITVGRIGNDPVVISLDWAEIEGVLVCFWRPTSGVVDYGMIQNWLANHYKFSFPNGMSTLGNADNFHLCILAIREVHRLNKLEKKEALQEILTPAPQKCHPTQNDLDAAKQAFTSILAMALCGGVLLGGLIGLLIGRLL